MIYADMLFLFKRNDSKYYDMRNEWHTYCDGIRLSLYSTTMFYSKP